jgi:hypothetical protein
MDLTDVLLRVLGAFYVFAGYIASRAVLTGMLVDRAISALSAGVPSRAEVNRALSMLATSVLVFAGGLALVLVLQIASWIFMASLAVQAIYFWIIAPRFLDPHDEPDPQGRRQSLNAFLIYAIATALVLWAHASERLLALPDASPTALALGAAAMVAFLANIGLGARKAPAPPSLDG